ncbi:MAG: twin-arginine translocase TatA/TatE family subunit [Actinobacteria bacterium]|nr:twin-arginine translocase TatA/TatE family subunit [Actinomycetota bacterium]
MDLGAPELLIVLLVVLVLFGGAKLPQLARSLGQAKNEFEKSVKGEPEPQSVPTPVALPASETVTLSRQELDRLVDERVDERTKAAEKTEAGEGSVH